MSFTFEDMKEKIRYGINYGNALECFDDHTGFTDDIIEHDQVDMIGRSHPIKITHMDYNNLTDDNKPTITECWCPEELWGNPETTTEIINYYKELGFTAVRLPVNAAWYHEFGSRHTDPKYLEYVRSVVDKIIDAGLFCCVVLFSEGYGAKFRDNAPYYEDPENNPNAKLIASHWTDVASVLTDIPEDKLAFELLNEFSFGAPNDDNILNQCKIIAKIYEMCINAIHKTGGYNAERMIGIGGYRGDANYTCDNFDAFAYLLENPKHYLSFAMYLMPECTFLYKDLYNGKTDTTSLLDKNRIAEDIRGFIRLHEDGYNIVVSEYGAPNIVDCKDDFENDELVATYMRDIYDLAVIERLWQDALDIPSYYWDNGKIFDRYNLKITISNIYDCIMLNLDDDVIEQYISLMRDSGSNGGD